MKGDSTWDNVCKLLKPCSDKIVLLNNKSLKFDITVSGLMIERKKHKNGAFTCDRMRKNKMYIYVL